MAQRTLTQLIDDIDGTLIADGEGRTVEFGLDGVSYAIELNDAHLSELKDALAPFMNAGRPVARRGSKASESPKASPTELRRIRKWARQNGHDASVRGRVSQAVRDAYDAAH